MGEQETQKICSITDEKTKITYKIIYRNSANRYEIWTQFYDAMGKLRRNRITFAEALAIESDFEKTKAYVNDFLVANHINIYENIAVVDTEVLEKAIIWFAKYIASKQKGKNVDFYSGYMEAHEGYKRDLYANGHAALKIETWNDTLIGTGKILKCVVDGLEAKDNFGKNNIVNYHAVTNLKNKANMDLALAEDILYNLFKGNDDKSAFEDACEFFGRWYPTFSYLMFLKDNTKYLPVMSSDKNHGDRFKKLNISRGCLSYCSWDNYQVFLDIHKQIQNKLIEALPANQISLLDAHSFVWTLYAAPDDFTFEMEDKLENIPGANNFVESVVSQINYNEKVKREYAELERIIQQSGITGVEKEVVTKARVNQGEFRKRLLLRYKKCCLCGVSDSRFLIASHIKPWCDSNPEERVDPDNGFLLCPNHDSAFDQFLISFDEVGKILISDKVQASDRIFLNIRDDMSIELNEGNKKYLEYHRAKFKGE